MYLSGVHLRNRLDSRLKHAGMTDFGKKISLTQQAAGNRPAEIKILYEAQEDLIEGFRFYEARETGVGCYSMHPKYILLNLILLV